MSMESASTIKTRLAADAGIAIGPILFIIAILGILAAAIAAGSGSFTTSTSGESNRTKAAALIDIGQNMKIGFDRIVANDVAYVSVDTDVTHTSETNDLFSPLGGGIAPPSTTMSSCPSATSPGCTAADVWHFYDVALAAVGIGTGVSPDKIAFIEVTEGVCDQINARANAVATPEQDMGVDLEALTPTAWPATLKGIPTGCIQNTNAAAGYFFYQVLGIQ